MALQRFVNPFVLAKAPNANVCSGSYLTLTSIFALLLYTFVYMVTVNIHPTTLCSDSNMCLRIFNLIDFIEKIILKLFYFKMSSFKIGEYQLRYEFY